MKKNIENKIKKTISWVSNISNANFYVIMLISLYVIIELSVIEWGIPGLNHPFPYHMDEWHQLEFIKNVFKYGTSDVSGATQIPIFHFILSGILLAPFYLIHYINPSTITSAIANLPEQHRLFILLRLNTLFFGVLSAVGICVISGKYLKSNKTITVLLFICTPIWLSLSNYYKYDIALCFWIIISLLSVLRLKKNHRIRDFMITGFVMGLAMGTKVSVFPLLLLIPLASVTISKRSKVVKVMAGWLTFLITFLLLGVPDIFYRLDKYLAFGTQITSELSHAHDGLQLPYPLIIYVFTKLLPTSFGYVFFTIFIFSFLYQLYAFIFMYINKKKMNYGVMVLISSIIFFSIPLIPLKLEAGTNRILVILPSLVLLAGISLIDAYRHFKNVRVIITILFSLGILLQFIQSFMWVQMRYFESPQQRTSTWIVHNISVGNIIGIEDIPIYQLLPDIMVKEFYFEKYNIGGKNIYKYKVINAQSEKLPNIIVITNGIIFQNYKGENQKKALLKRLVRENFKKIVIFKPDLTIFKYFGDDLDFYLSGLLAMPISTEIYIKK